MIKYFIVYRPFWLSPRQAVVVPVGQSYDEYAKKVSFISNFEDINILLQIFFLRIYIVTV